VKCDLINSGFVPKVEKSKYKLYLVRKVAQWIIEMLYSR
jgi:hypothetical protein